MIRHDQENIHVSRDALIAFAWSAPMRDLAVKVGLSDVGLKKLLRSQGIVTPPQGHWNRIHAGQCVPDRPRSPPRQPGQTGRICLDSRFRDLIEEAPPVPVDGPFASAAVPEDLEKLRAQELNAIGKVGIPRNLIHPHVGLVQLLKREEKRRHKVAESHWHWDKPLFDTALGQRQLKLYNGLFHALSRRGHSGDVREDSEGLSAQCHIGDMSLSLSFSILSRHRAERIEGRSRLVSDLSASTPLRWQLGRKFRSPVPSVWDDDGDSKLESKLAVIAADIIVAGEAAFRQSLIEAVEREEQWRKWQEERRQRHIAELEAQRLKDLKTSGMLLAQAEEIRTLVTRMKSAVVVGATHILAEDLERWERWGLDYADRLDPILSGQVLSHIHVPELD